MNESFAGAALTKAREEFQKVELQCKDSERRIQLARDMSRQAKMKFKQARKWARQTRKLLKKAKADAADKFKLLERAINSLKKAEKKASKGPRKTHAKIEPVATKSGKISKPIAKKKPAPAAKKKTVKRAPKKSPTRRRPPVLLPPADLTVPLSEVTIPVMPSVPVV